MKQMNEGALYSLLPAVEKVVTKNAFNSGCNVGIFNVVLCVFYMEEEST